VKRRLLALSLLAGLAGLCSQNVHAQTENRITSRRIAIYGGFSWVSNSFNSWGNFQSSGMSGWDADATLPVSSRFSVKLEGLGFYDNHLGDPDHAHFILAGPQMERHFRRDMLFAYALAGYGHINPKAIIQGINIPGTTSTFSTDLGAGIDIPIARRLAWRAEGGVLYASFPSASDQISARPNWFGRISSGIVVRF